MAKNPSGSVVLTFMAHPDDAEILCGGTLALLAERGWTVHITAAAPGDCGTPSLSPDEIGAIRRREGAEAAAVIGGTFHCLERRDLRIFYDEDGVRRAAALLRRTRPDVVITHSPSDYMLDHEETSHLARAACFNAPIPNAPVSEDGLEPLGRIPHLFYADPIEGIDIHGRAVEPSFLVDVSAVIERKLEMLSRHASQREWLRRHHGMDEYLEACRRWSAERGRRIGAGYAEGFRQHLGHAYPRDNVLAQVLGERVREV